MCTELFIILTGLCNYPDIQLNFHFQYKQKYNNKIRCPKQLIFLQFDLATIEILKFDVGLI